MGRQRSSSLPWRFSASDPLALPNARIALALLRAVSCLPGTYPKHNHDDLGAAFAPVLAGLLPQLRSAVQAHLAATHGAIDIDASDVAVLHESRDVQTLFGEALAQRHPAFRALLVKVEDKLEHFVARHSHPCDANVETLARLLRLTAHETVMLRLATAFCHGTLERSLFSFVDSPVRIAKVVERLCGARDIAVVRMFYLHHALAYSGLFAFSSRACSNNGDLGDLLRLSDIGEKLLASPMSSTAEMANAVLTPLPSPSADAARLEWPHLADARTLLGAALSEAVERGTQGVNILLHGAPGTGKTEFAAALLVSIGAAGFSIDSVNNWGDETSRSGRLAKLRLAQTFADQRQSAVLVLDEAEDIFQSDYQSPFARVFDGPRESKSWTNHLLEHNAHPVIWISNEVGHLDPAYLRRFTFCLEFPRTPHALLSCSSAFRRTNGCRHPSCTGNCPITCRATCASCSANSTCSRSRSTSNATRRASRTATAGRSVRRRS